MTAVELLVRLAVVKTNLPDQSRSAQRLRKAEAALWALPPEVGRGTRQYRDAGTLDGAIAAVLERYGVAGLLHVQWQRQEQSRTRYVGRGRGSPQRPTRTEVQWRYVVTAVERDEAAIAHEQYRLGWRVQVTNLPALELPLTQSVLHYRGGWCLERDFHRLKDRPLGISPLYVRCDAQIKGLTRRLLLALRLLVVIETQVRRGLAQAGQALTGLYEGQPTRTTDHPTGRRRLKAVARAEITLTRVEQEKRSVWHLSPLPQWLVQVLGYLGLALSLYTRLVENSS